MADSQSEKRFENTKGSVVEQRNPKNQDSATVKKVKPKKFKTPQQWKILLAAFEKDSSPVYAGTLRAEEIVKATGLGLHEVQFWFHSRRTTLKNSIHRGVEKTPDQLEVLLAAYKENPRPPQRNCERMQKLITATNLESVRIQQWFWDRVKRARKNGVRLDFGEDANKDENDFNMDRIGKCRWKTPEQIEILLAAYAEDPSPPKIDTARAKKLCSSTGIDFKGIRDWFGVRRRKLERLGNREDKMHPMNVKRPEQLEALKEAFAKDPNRVYKDTERATELIAATGLSLREIQGWFNRMQRTVVGAPVIRNHRTPQQLKLLFTACEQNPEMPHPKTDRLKDLCSATGLKPKTIINWYGLQRRKIMKGKATERKEMVAKLEKKRRQQEILHEAFDDDSSVPAPRSDRLNELCAATGLSDRYIKEWFKQQKIIRRARERERLQEESEGVSSQNEEPNEVPTQENSAGKISGNSKNTSEDRNLSKTNNKKGLPKSTRQRGNKKVKKTVAPLKKNQAQRDYTSKDNDDCVIIDFSQNVMPANKRNLEQENPVPTKEKKCPICDVVCSEHSVAIVSLKEAQKMDKFFGSSLGHFLSYSCAVRVCVVHIDEHRIGVSAA